LYTHIENYPGHSHLSPQHSQVRYRIQCQYITYVLATTHLHEHISRSLYLDGLHLFLSLSLNTMSGEDGLEPTANTRYHFHIKFRYSLELV